MLELYYNFFFKICNVNKFEEFEIDIDSLYHAFAENNWKTEYDLEWKQSGSNCGQKIVPIVLLFMQFYVSSPEGAVISTRKHDKEAWTLHWANRWTEMLC